MYKPVIETISDFKNGIKKHGLMLSFFFLGVAVGFIGLSGLAALLMEKDSVIVTCAFIGFIIGTFPELWKDAGSKGRNKFSYLALIVGFLIMITLLFLLKFNFSYEISADIYGFLLCGVLWGLSLIVPGLSSSSLLLFFGLYQPMLKGISSLNFSVLIPMAVGMVICVLILSKIVGFTYKRHYSLMSHTVLGIVAATAVMIYPFNSLSVYEALLKIVVIIAGGAVSYVLGNLCNKVKEATKP